MRLDTYTCSTCGEGFSVEEDKQPIACPFCESKCFEFSHTIIGSKMERIEEFLQRLDMMSGTGNGIGQATVKKIRDFAEKEGFIQRK
ncbi:hypothetical protein [Anoxybacteroides amylolyticum]|uniref:Zinc ribbon domain protein n=1 Tax=Anoxybacteroides amylolyticum TaxID=294699 RepID=A0A160F5Q9_9BACL|nr:hypothetical protein [Anoxybacillus amylolyticus]ANB61877.1 hypothetical protein GFC30_2758 [Anoxybacillus amylolyticus]